MFRCLAWNASKLKFMIQKRDKIRSITQKRREVIVFQTESEKHSKCYQTRTRTHQREMHLTFDFMRAAIITIHTHTHLVRINFTVHIVYTTDTEQRYQWHYIIGRLIR